MTYPPNLTLFFLLYGANFCEAIEKKIKNMKQFFLIIEESKAIDFFFLKRIEKRKEKISRFSFRIKNVIDKNRYCDDACDLVMGSFFIIIIQHLERDELVFFAY